MDEHRRAILRKEKIRTPRQPRGVEAVSKSPGVEGFPKLHFGTRILAPQSAFEKGHCHRLRSVAAAAMVMSVSATRVSCS